MRNETAEIKVGGMICRACSDAVESALYATRGVISAKVSYWKGTAEVEYDPDVTDRDKLSKSIERSGYQADERGLNGIVVDIICALLIAALTWQLLRSGMSPVAELMGGGAEISPGYVFLMGLLTSTHCIGMCGGIILSQTTDASSLDGGPQRRRRGLAASLSYNAGRTLSYALLGGVFGALGTVITYTAKAKSIVFVMAGLAVALIGIQMLGLLPGLRRLSPEQKAPCALPLRARRAFVGKPLIIGILTGLMPCGPLYAMWLYSMSTGSFLRGAAAMLCFALGTAPLLLAFGALNSFIPARWTKYMLKLSAVLVCSIGLKMLIKGLMLSCAG